MSDNTIRQFLKEQSHTVRPTTVPRIRRTEVYVALRLLGADEHDLLLPETRHLAQLLREGEVLTGGVYGSYDRVRSSHTGRGLLAITNYRLLLVDRGPLILRFDDIQFQAVRRVKYRITPGMKTVTLNMRKRDLTMHVLNDRCAREFTQTVDDMIMAKDRGW